MTRVAYWSEDDGALYPVNAVDGATEDGAKVEGFIAYRIEESFTLTIDDLTIGQNDILQVLLIHDPPLATRV